MVADGLCALLRQVLLAKDVELQERVLLHVLAAASVLRHILELLLGLLHIFLYAGKNKSDVTEPLNKFHNDGQSFLAI